MTFKPLTRRRQQHLAQVLDTCQQIRRGDDITLQPGTQLENDVLFLLACEVGIITFGPPTPRPAPAPAVAPLQPFQPPARTETQPAPPQPPTALPQPTAPCAPSPHPYIPLPNQVPYVQYVPPISPAKKVRRKDNICRCGSVMYPNIECQIPGHLEDED